MTTPDAFDGFEKQHIDGKDVWRAGTGPAVIVIHEMPGLHPGVVAFARSHEAERLVAVLRSLKGRFPMVLVEHDMTAVFALADRISVMIYGRILASGPPAQVRADPQVVAAYLGEEME